MRLHDDDLMNMHFVLYLEELRELMFAYDWSDDEMFAWGECAIEAIAYDDADPPENHDRRAGLLLSLPAWTMHLHDDLSPAAMVAIAIQNAEDGSSFERSVLMDGHELLDFEDMFRRVRAFAQTSAILCGDEEQISLGESGEEIRGLAVLPAYAAFELVWLFNDADPEKANKMAMELAAAGLYVEGCDDY